MLFQHFQIHPMYREQRIPGWHFSFYFLKHKYTGIYQSDGKINWLSTAPDKQYEATLQKHVHDLMIYHVYDYER